LVAISRMIGTWPTARIHGSCSPPAPDACARVWLAGDNCRCSTRAEAAVPTRIVAKLRMEKKGRGGKTVTVVDGLPDNATFLKELSQELKRCAAPAAPSPTAPSSCRATCAIRIREYLTKKGWIVKG
jgi:translation initiation factor 1